jgi:hypothetical protein
MLNEFTEKKLRSQDREEIYKLRHDVYACELEQHPLNRDGAITDLVDDFPLRLGFHGRPHTMQVRSFSGHLGG